jgi:hypothetical protein
LQDNREYFSDAKAVDKLIEEHFLNMLSEEDINRILGLREGEEFG